MLVAVGGVGGVVIAVVVVGGGVLFITGLGSREKEKRYERKGDEDLLWGWLERGLGEGVR